MRVGSIAIANDLLGVIIDMEKDLVKLKDKQGTVRSVAASSCVEIIDPYATSLLLLEKLRKEVNE